MSKVGRLTVICGPMFSGKTEELLRLLRRAKIARRNVLLFKPISDARYFQNRVVPHYLAPKNVEKPKMDEQAGIGEPALAVKDASSLLKSIQEKLFTKKIDFVAIEEGQFFDDDLAIVVEQLLAQGVDIAMSLLDQDFRRNPFPIGEDGFHAGNYLAMAHDCFKLTAICIQCGGEAYHTQKLVLGSDGQYAPAGWETKTVAVGTMKDLAEDQVSEIYEARCHQCHEIETNPLTDNVRQQKLF